MISWSLRLEIVSDVLDAFEAYCSPSKNELYEWYVFWSMSQSTGEPIDTYLKRLKTQAGRCEFDAGVKPKMLLCRVVFGISSIKLRERLLRDNAMTLDRAVNELRVAEMKRNQLDLMADGDRASARQVSVVERKTESVEFVGSQDTDQKKLSCKYCSYDHVKGKCPAYGKICRKCGKKNNFPNRCLSRGIRSVENGDNNLDQPVNILFIGTVGTDGSYKSKTRSWSIELNIGKECIDNFSFKVDTGAEVNTITQTMAQTSKADIVPSKVRLLGYNGTVIKNHGHVIIPVRYGSAHADLRFEVVNNDLTPVLGLKYEVSSSDILDDFPDVFEGLGCLQEPP